MPLWQAGFRPFFLAAAVAGFAPVLAWVLLLSGLLPATGYVDLRAWHAHEMLFGYVVAVMAGFLLTAVRNWTGRDTTTPAGLRVLVLLWLAGRIAMLASAWLPPLVVALADLLFLPALAFTVVRPIILSDNRRNLVFPALLLALALLNAGFHAGFHAAATGLSTHELLPRLPVLSALVAVLMIVVMGGRVIPFFTERGLATPFRARRVPALELLAAPSVVVFALALLFFPQQPAVPLLAVLAAVVHAGRLAGWYTPAIRAEPLLWSLQLGYAWLPAGFLLHALAWFGIGRVELALHAFTAGAIASVTLGMMARVALGHTGRHLVVARLTQVAFLLVQLAALLRVLVPLLLPSAWVPAMQLAALLWALALLCFLRVYTPILLGKNASAR